MVPALVLCGTSDHFRVLLVMPYDLGVARVLGGAVGKLGYAAFDQL